MSSPLDEMCERAERNDRNLTRGQCLAEFRELVTNKSNLRLTSRKFKDSQAPFWLRISTSDWWCLADFRELVTKTSNLRSDGRRQTPFILRISDTESRSFTVPWPHPGYVSLVEATMSE